MTADAEPQQPAPVDPAILRVVRRVGIFHMRQNYAGQEYDGIKQTAKTPFAAIRERGIKNVEITLPDGSPVGLIAIKAGGKRYSVDDAALELVIACNEPEGFHDVASPAALTDPAVIKLLAERFPRYVSAQVKPDVLARYDEELKRNDGKVIDRASGEFVTVATVTPVKPTGEYSVTWYDQGKGMIRLQEALDAGLIGMDGDVAEHDEDPQTLPGPAESGNPTVPQKPAEAGEPAPDPTPAAGPDPGAAATPSTAADSSASADDAMFPAPNDDVDERLDRALKAGGTRPRDAPKHKPTDEQAAIIAAIRDTTEDIAVEAGAGTGKTSVLQMAAQEYRARGYYLVFGHANAAEAKRKFPRHVQAMTTSSLAMAATGRPLKHRLGGSQVPAWELAKMLGINMPLAVDNRILAPQQQARLVNAMVKNYALSADAEIGPQHCPRRPGLDSPTAMATLRHNLMRPARKAWADLISPDGKLKFDHHVYVKLWQLTDPQFPVDFVLLDEAQDTDEVVLAVFNGQRSARRIVVGDSNQAIHEWRGAVNALAQFDGTRLRLTQSFRFGSAIASEANKWLTVLESDMRLTGSPRISSMLADLPQAGAVLCRTNGTAMAQAMQLLDEGRKVAIVGGGGQIRQLAEAAISLKDGNGSTHPELMAFKTWAEVQDHVENDPSGQDLKVFVQLIDDHGPEGIIACIDQLSDESDADTVVSTAHKSKGLEWNAVRIADDFHPPAMDPEHPDDDPVIPAEMARLAYVAVTRARLSLDRSGLAWVDRFLPQAGEQ